MWDRVKFIRNSGAGMQKQVGDISLPVNRPGINFSDGLKTVRNNKNLFLKLLYMFCRDHKDDSQVLHKCLHTGDLVTAQRIAHTLKGISGTIGAMNLHTATNALNMALLNGRSTEAVQPLLKSVENSLAMVVGSIEELGLEEEFGILNCSSPVIEKEGVVELVSQLEAMVQDLNPDSIEKAKEISCHLVDSSLAPVATRVVEKLEMFEFDLAQLDLAKLKVGLKTL